ncbi:MAG: hypothetical protein Kow0098_13980 [Ignavibacteriaceae bacterium]
MSETKPEQRKVFRYNMSFYYQSTIIYFIAFILYVVIRGEFVKDTFTITQDPVLYFFAFIVLISVIALLFNIVKNRYLEITEREIIFTDRFRSRPVRLSDIEEIKFSKRKSSDKRRAFNIIKIKLKTRRRPLLIRPFDYENEKELSELFKKIKTQISSANNV